MLPQSIQRRRGAISLVSAAVSLLVSAPLMTATALAATPNGLSSLKQSSPPPIDSNTRFACQNVNGEYTVMYYPQSQPNQGYAWAVPSMLGGGWTPERRCAEISRRLESYRPDGLQELQTGMENGYNVICATTEQVPGCRIVLTVPPGQDPVATRDRVFENLTVADSGQQTDGVTTFTGGDQNDLLGRIGEVLNLPSSNRRTSNGIDLRPFLDQADGGTGTQLGSGATQSSPARLNPGNFR